MLIFSFLIIKKKALLNIKRLYNKANKPTKRETKLYEEDSKNDIRHGQRPYKEGSKTPYKEGNNYNNSKNNNLTPTTTNNTIAKTPNDTKLDHKP